MNLDPSILAVGGIWYIAFIVSTTLHEASHGLAAHKFGDPTAHLHGLVTLDPVPHVRRSPFGMVVVPIISYLLNGWMIGWASAPYDPLWASANRKRAALMSLAGPASNLLLVIVASVLIRAGMIAGFFVAPEYITFSHVTAATEPTGSADSAALVISIFWSLNLILFVFNLIPLPPLDGSGVMSLFLDDTTAEKYQQFLSAPGVQVVGMVVAWKVMDIIFPAVQDVAIMLLYPGLSYS